MEFRNSFSPDLCLIRNVPNALLDCLRSLVAGLRAVILLSFQGKLAAKGLDKKHCCICSLIRTQQASLCFCQLLLLNFPIPVPPYKQHCNRRTHRNLCVSTLRHNWVWQLHSESSISRSSEALQYLLSFSAFGKSWPGSAGLAGWPPPSTPEKTASPCSAVMLPPQASAFCLFPNFGEDDTNKNSSFQWPHLPCLQ